MISSDSLWQRDGRNIEELPDPFTPPVFEPVPEDVSAQPPPAPVRRRRWRYVAYAIAAVLLVTLLWLIISAPLGRALEPLDDPAILLVS